MCTIIFMSSLWIPMEHSVSGLILDIFNDSFQHLCLGACEPHRWQEGCHLCCKDKGLRIWDRWVEPNTFSGFWQSLCEYVSRCVVEWLFQQILSLMFCVEIGRWMTYRVMMKRPPSLLTTGGDSPKEYSHLTSKIFCQNQYDCMQFMLF